MNRTIEAGDICWVDFDPALGSEQHGTRPALVLTSAEFHQNSRRAIVCPITSNTAAWPTKISLPAGMRTRGAVLADQVRSVSRAERGFRFIEHAPADVLTEVRDIVGELLQVGRSRAGAV